MRTILAIALSGLFYGEVHAQANLFTLAIEDYPAATLSECTRSAESIGARLAALSGVESYSQQCTPDRLNARTFDISVSYLAEKRVSAVDASDASYASYQNGAACLADLARTHEVAGVSCLHSLIAATLSALPASLTSFSALRRLEL